MPSLTEGEPLHRRIRDDHLLYLMLKPPLPAAQAMDRLRLDHGLARKYAMDRFHMTLVPLGDIRAIPAVTLAHIRFILASLQAEPFEVCLNRINGNALAGSRMAALRDFQKMLVTRLTNAGIYLPEYDFRPHVSLCYSEWVLRSVPVSPIHWCAEELLLINSIHGKGHDELGRWPLVARQGSLF